MNGSYEVPYEMQVNDWSSGAAALAMVYRSFGIACCQNAIWDNIGGTLRGRPGSRAQTLVVDALRRHLHAWAIQVRDPWLVLERCYQSSIRVIINHQPRPGGRIWSLLRSEGVQ